MVKLLEVLPQLDPIPDFVHEILARPDRAQLAPVEGFEYDRPRAIAAAYGHIDKLLRDSDIPEQGNRDEHVFRFMARMHGVGVGQERAHALYDEFLQISGGAPPEGWPNDPKTWSKIQRVWARITADNPPGSELVALTIEEAAGALTQDDPDRLPDDRLWDIEDLVNRPSIVYWDREKLFPHVNGGYVGVWFGKFGHHKTNFMLSKLRELMTDTDAKVLYLMGEGIGGMGTRLAAQIDFADRAMIEFRGRFKAQRVPHMANKDDIARMATLCAAEGYKPDVIVIDTLATAISGLDEDNKTASMLNANGPIGGIARAFGCLLILIGHEGEKAGKLRGGFGFYGNVDQVVYIKANTDAYATALTATSEAPAGKVRDGEPTTVYYAIQYHRGVPIPVPTSKAGYEMLTGKADWTVGTVGGAVTKIGRPVGAEIVVMEMYPRGDMDPEDWQARCATLARKLDRAAKEGGHGLEHLFEVGEGGALIWRP